MSPLFTVLPPSVGLVLSAPGVVPSPDVFPLSGVVVLPSQFPVPSPFPVPVPSPCPVPVPSPLPVPVPSPLPVPSSPSPVLGCCVSVSGSGPLLKTILTTVSCFTFEPAASVWLTTVSFGALLYSF